MCHILSGPRKAPKVQHLRPEVLEWRAEVWGCQPVRRMIQGVAKIGKDWQAVTHSGLGVVETGNGKSRLLERRRAQFFPSLYLGLWAFRPLCLCGALCTHT